MREIIFDTETTGLDNQADRIIEIGAVELENRFPTGRTFHVFLDPEGRAVHPEALAVHGISNEMLIGKPAFRQVVSDWFAFTEGAKLVAHNASFDVGFFNAEYARMGFPPIHPDRVIDSLSLARRRHPMGPNSLDGLCKRYGIDNSRRVHHGALLDSELLAEVYIELIGGKQAALGLDTVVATGRSTQTTAEQVAGPGQRPTALPPRFSDEERALHGALVDGLGEAAIWRRYS